MSLIGSVLFEELEVGSRDLLGLGWMGGWFAETEGGGERAFEDGGVTVFAGFRFEEVRGF